MSYFGAPCSKIQVSASIRTPGVTRFSVSIIARQAVLHAPIKNPCEIEGKQVLFVINLPEENWQVRFSSVPPLRRSGAETCGEYAMACHQGQG